MASKAANLLILKNNDVGVVIGHISYESRKGILCTGGVRWE